MNSLWRVILRNRAIASIRVHRFPPTRALPTGGYAHTMPLTPMTGIFSIGGTFFQSTHPYIHIIFKREHAEPWMTEFESNIPKTPRDWLIDHGFGGMEYFNVKVGVAPVGTTQ